MFAWFHLLMSFMLFHVVEDEGGVGDIGDFIIEDEEQPEDKKEENEEIPDKPSPEGQSVLDDEIKELKAFKEEIETERATTEAVSALVAKYPDFDATKIAGHLSAIAKEHGADEAEKFNNPLGWENIYLTKHQKESSDSYFDRGRGETKEPFDFKKGFEKAYGGDKQSIEKLLENSKG